MAKSTKRDRNATAVVKKRTPQSDVPTYSLTHAIRVPQAIADNLGLQPGRPLTVAQAMNVQPTSGPFRAICGASIAYGLTSGGYNAPQIALTPLGRRVVAPTSEGDDARARREALLRPRVLRVFLQRYDGARVPREDIAVNVLSEMGVPRESAKRTFDLIIDGARAVGFLRDLNGVHYVDLQGTPLPSAATPDANDDTALDDIENGEDDSAADAAILAPEIPPIQASVPAPDQAMRVFISHGRNMEIVDQIKTMLNVAEVEYEIAVETEATAIPVPDKIFSAMRNCTAAVIAVTADPAPDGSAPPINQNVLIEIGAAFVLYDKRVILLWDKRLAVPSNLQGLYRCEFQGNELSWGAGMKLMEAIKKFKAR